MKRKSNILTILAVSVIVFCCLVVAPITAMAADLQAPAEKDETVYVYTDSTGSLKSTEVSVLLKNDTDAIRLQDVSNLTDLESKDELSFTALGDSIVWDADGKNVSYTGKSATQAPVTLKVSYELDGAPIEPSKIAGKSGRVMIRFEFTNHSSITADINGSRETVYTPFTCISAIMLDGNDFKNVSVENCKVINDGDDMIIAGYAMPGLKESLGSFGENANIPDSFSFSADVTNFELKSTMTIITSGLLSDIDGDSLGVGLDGDASALTDAMNQLIKGSDSLTTGLNQLSDSINEFEDGTSAVESGIGELGSGLSELAGQEGLILLASYEHSLATAIGKLGDSTDELKDALIEASGELASAAETKEAFDNASGIMSAHASDIVGEGKLTPEEYNAVMTALGTGSQMSTSVSNVADQLEGAADGIQAFKTNAEELEGKAETIAFKIESAAAAASQLAEGADKLEGYANQLNQAVPALAEGAQTAAEGSQALSDGMKALNNDGLSQLINSIQERMDGVTARVNVISNASKSYTNFSGITPGTTGSVKFIIETEPIKKA